MVGLAVELHRSSRFRRPRRLEADMANPKWQAVINKNRVLAQELGISGTPGFIVGNELVPGALDLKGLKELIARGGRGK
ncbi:MAG: DsbA family protein [Nitrospira sp.]|jgi:protein-disulfide isomerase|nr:DsbA family protein [Nitrospira sp.]MDH4243991.1 DsbA family protein [Nitrospira sp.]MDH4354892.1 DsbA family protein [Nitrospira sp.]MDH5319601.1 DsbA family protein [Nitrospira sp.]